MLNKKSAYEIIDKALSYCNYYTMITLKSKDEGITRFANSEIHQNVYNEDNVLTISVYDGKKESRVTTNLLDEDSIKMAVKDAEENLKFIPEGEMEIIELTEPTEITYEKYDKELDKKFDTINRSNLIKKGIDLLNKDYTAAGALSLIKSAIAMGNNRGVKRYNRTDKLDFNTVVMYKDGSSGYTGYTTNKAHELDVVKEFKTAYEKAKMSVNAISIDPGSYTVILEPEAVSSLLSYMSYVGFSARSTQIGTGFLTGKIGKKVFGDNITIKDDTYSENTLPFYFDFEGYQKKPLNIIEKGVVKELAYDVKSAVKDNTETTGHSVDMPKIGGLTLNLIMDGGDKCIEDLIKSTKKGILVTRFHYMNIVNPRQALLTALTRDGTFLIEDGKIKCGIKNMRFTESMLNAFNNVVGITRERKKVGKFGVSYVPALKVEDFHFTGKTELN